MNLRIVFAYKLRDLAVGCDCVMRVPSGIRKKENGGPEDEENFEEAIKNVNTALTPTKVPHLKYSWLCPIQHISPFMPQSVRFLACNRWQSSLVRLLSCNVSCFPQIPSTVEDLFNSEECNDITSQVFYFFLSTLNHNTHIVVFETIFNCGVLYLFVCVNQTPSFWVMLRAVKEFTLNQGNGSLPVRGTIPDMIADSQKFINLQNV